MTRFPQKEPFVALAVIPKMPLTLINEPDYERINEIIAYRLPNNLWTRRFFPDSFSTENLEELKALTAKQNAAIDFVGKELFGGDEQLYAAW